MDKTKLRLLLEYFDRNGWTNKRTGSTSKSTKLGVYMPSDIRKINGGLEQLSAEGHIPDDGWFLEAGFGDLRVALLMAGVYGINTLAVEEDQKLFYTGEKNLASVGGKEFLGTAKLILVRGDFRDDRTYDRAGIPFREIRTAMNFYSGHIGLTKKIVDESPIGTTFIFQGPYSHFPGLTFQTSVQIDDPSKTIESRLHAYRKLT